MIDYPTVDIILDTRYVRKDNKSRVKIRVTYQRKQKYYRTPYILSQDEFSKAMSGRSRTEKYILLKRKLDKAKESAKEIISKLEDFTFEGFELLFNDPKGKASVKAVYDNYINDLKREGRAGTVQNYQSSINSLIKFMKDTSGKSTFYFKDVSKTFLNSYEHWMIEKGKSLNTIGMYLRPLRVIFNKAISDQIVKKVLYPFGKNKYQIPSGVNVKKALNIDEISKLYNYETIPGSPEDRAKDIWFFSYLCNGMNIRDICELRFKSLDFDDEKIVFVRKKTERSTRHRQKVITAILSDEVKEIIRKWGNKSTQSNNYVFPFLNLGDDSETRFKRVRQVTKTVNKYMKRIGEELEFKIPVTTYTARHSYSTILKRSGVSVEFISESLGHTDIKTTENYLDSFDLDSKRETMKNLLNFKK